MTISLICFYSISHVLSAVKQIADIFKITLFTGFNYNFNSRI